MFFFFLLVCFFIFFFFFFQAEDGIRDLYVTGVQTCALPIWRLGRHPIVGPAGVAVRPDRGAVRGWPPRVARRAARSAAVSGVGRGPGSAPARARLGGTAWRAHGRRAANGTTAAEGTLHRVLPARVRRRASR